MKFHRNEVQTFLDIFCQLPLSAGCDESNSFLETESIELLSHSATGVDSKEKTENKSDEVDDDEEDGIRLLVLQKSMDILRRW